MYTLYASKNTYSMSTHLLLEELQVDYQIKWFDIKNVADHPVEFKTINPNLTVPAVITADGPLTESAAILVYLAEKHGHQFMPEINDSNRSQFWQWQFYLMSTLQPEVLNQFHPERYHPNDLDSQNKLRVVGEWMSRSVSAYAWCLRWFAAHQSGPSCPAVVPTKAMMN